MMDFVAIKTEPGLDCEDSFGYLPDSEAKICVIIPKKEAESEQPDNGIEDMIELGEVKVEIQSDDDRKPPSSLPDKSDGSGSFNGITMDSKPSLTVIQAAVESKKTTQKSETIECTICQKVCRDKTSLANHRRVVHGPKKYECLICGIRFRAEYLLRYHEFSIRHTSKVQELKSEQGTPAEEVQNETEANADVQQFQCDLCPSSFRTMKKLMTHKLCHRPKNFPCPECQRSFLDQWTLDKHFATHEAAKTPFACDDCPKVFNSRANLSNHRVRHKPKTHVCHICSFKFGTRAHLTRHMNGHTRWLAAEKTSTGSNEQIPTAGQRHRGTPFPCSKCDKICKSMFGLSEHNRYVHESICCKFCSRTFTDVSTLEDHQRLCESKLVVPKTHKCNICHKKYAVRFYLDKHMKTHNKNHQEATRDAGDRKPRRRHKNPPKSEADSPELPQEDNEIKVEPLC